MYFRDKAQLFVDADGKAREVELPPRQTMECAGWECVMIVVPALTKGQDADDGIIAALVRGFEHPGAVVVTNGVYGPCDM